jgi:hypothetical protein
MCTVLLPPGVTQLQLNNNDDDNNNDNNNNNKGKAIPLRSLTGPEGSRRLRLQDFKIIST